MAQLEDIIENLKKEAVKKGHPMNKILKIEGLENLEIQVNAVPNNKSARISFTIHYPRMLKRQLAVTPEVANDLVAIAKFLKKYEDVIEKYVSKNNRTESDYIELSESTKEKKVKSNELDEELL